MKRLVRPLAVWLLISWVFLEVSVGSASAEWITEGVPVCAAPNRQGGSVSTSDGCGGAIVCWGDSRGGAFDVYASRIDSRGTVLWTTNGVAVCTAPGYQSGLGIISDGAGGAFVVWADERAGATNDDIYAQRVSAAGLGMWAVDGVPVCLAQGEQRYPVITTDGMGGAIIVWEDARTGTNADIYAQRISANGDACWQVDGVALCSETSLQRIPVVASDMAGGAIAAWNDVRTDDPDDELGDLYAQRVTGAGDVLWATSGVPICAFVTGQWPWSMISDGAGGAIVGWEDTFGLMWEQSDVYVQRISALGEIQWAERGVALSNTYFDNQTELALTAAGVGGAIVAWSDWGGNEIDVFAQRVDPAGNPLWTTNGVPVCNVPGPQYHPAIVTDGAGGAIIAWQDDDPGLNHADVRAGRIDPSGNVLWGSQGAPVSTAPNDQKRPAIVSDGGGGAIIVWSDGRNNTISDYDVYAQRIGPEGLVPTGVRDDGARTPGLVVKPGVPNPFSATTSIDIQLDEASDVNLQVYDVRGRRVRHWPLGVVGAGPTRLDFDGRDDAGDVLPSGVYFCRVAAGGNSAVLKLTIAR